MSCFKKLSSGTIKINWNFENGVFVLSINVPFNTSAVITLPDGKSFEVSNGKYAKKRTETTLSVAKQ